MELYILILSIIILILAIVIKLDIEEWKRDIKDVITKQLNDMDSEIRRINHTLFMKSLNDPPSYWREMENFQDSRIQRCETRLRDLEKAINESIELDSDNKKNMFKEI